MLPYASPLSQVQILGKRDFLTAFRHDPVGFLRLAANEQGDIARFRLAGRNVILVSRPALVRSLLITHAASFKKGPGLVRANAILGDGMLTAEPPRHTASRRRLQPAFTRTAIDAYVPAMTEVIASELDTWPDGATIDLSAAMSRITLAVAGRCLFGVDFSAMHADEVATAIADALAATYGSLHEPMTPARGRSARLASSKATLSSITDHALGTAPGCPFASGPVPHALSIGELAGAEAREEALTILLAAQESLSIGLTWTFALLAAHPRLQPGIEMPGYNLTECPSGAYYDEGVAADPRSRRRSFGTLEPRLQAQGTEYPSGAEDLVYARAVLSESMRLYPPAWLLTREATREVRLADDLTVASGTIVLAAPCVSHVDPNRWDRAAEFIPERWLEQPHPHTGLYFPFGLGPRNCIGEQFAWTEGAIAITQIASRYTIEVAPFQAEDWDPLVNLRPRNPVIAQVRRR